MSETISVIVPVYKVEKYITKCVDSILAQTYHELDVILVDDGSPDDCGRICDEYSEKDNRIRVIHKENGGLSSARNAALDVAKGSWIICVDSDDYIHPDLIRRLYDAVISNSAQISICSHYEVSNDKLLITQKIVDEVIVWDKHTALKKLVEDTDIKSYAWGKLYKRELFDGVRYPNGRNYEDIATTYFLFDKADRIAKIPDFLYYYLIRKDGISYNNSTVSWHKGCHATCLGQEERAEYFKGREYKELYQLAMAKLLPYLYSDINSGYKVSAASDISQTKDYLKKNIEEFSNNPHISEKDKRIIRIYLKGNLTYNIYTYTKNKYKSGARFIRKVKKKICPPKGNYDFSLLKTKKNRLVYFELPCFDNLGDHAIAYVTENLLKREVENHTDYQLFTVDAWNTDNAVNTLKKCVLPGDIIICQGGGNFGNLYEFAEVFRRKVISSFRPNRIIVMPQTFFYTNDKKGKKELETDQKIINGCKDITLFARDSISFDLMKQYFNCDVFQMHDVVSMYDGTSFESKDRDGILVCLRSDKESALNCNEKQRIIEVCESISKNIVITDTCTQYNIDTKDRIDILEKKLKLFGKADVVVTDRLHGMIFSIITETPCVVLGNNHHKVLETYKTFSNCDYIKYVNSCNEVEKAIKELMEPGRIIKRIDLSDDLQFIMQHIFKS